MSLQQQNTYLRFQLIESKTDVFLAPREGKEGDLDWSNGEVQRGVAIRNFGGLVA